MDAAATARAVLTGELAAVEAVEAALAALDSHRDLNAAITVCGDEALARARGGVTGRLAGVPILVKDMIDTAGVRTTYGSRIYADHVPRRSAPAVERLEAEGAIVIGKANCDEFAWGVTGHNVWWGDAQNPRRPGRITGGSSSGNAAALAAGIVPIALGSDTGGSVRMPAACCDVVGIKPPLGGVPTEGNYPLCPSFDTVAPMAATASDCALAYSVLTGDDVPEPRLAGLTIGALTYQPHLGPPTADAERDERALAHVGALEALGAHVVEAELPVPDADTWPLFYAEAAQSHRDTFPARRDEYGPTIRAKLDDAQDAHPVAVEQARAAVVSWRTKAAVEPAVDLFVSPTLGVYEIPTIDVDEIEIRLTFSAYTRVFGYLGWPAAAIGGVQFGGRDAATVIAAALAWEQAAGAAGVQSGDADRSGELR